MTWILSEEKSLLAEMRAGKNSKDSKLEHAIMKKLLFAVLFVALLGYANLSYSYDVSRYSLRNIFEELQRDALCKKQENTMNTYLEYADWERDLANAALQSINRDVEIIKNIDVKSKLKSLLGTIISTSMISNPKEQVLAVFVSTLSGCVSEFTGETIHKLLDIKRSICNACYYLEASNTHLKMAMGLPMYVHPSVDVNRYFSGADALLEGCVMRLITIDMHCTAFQFNIESTAFAKHVQTLRNQILNEIEKNGRVVSIHSEDIENLMENMSEILSESPNFDSNTFGECYGLLEESFKMLSKAERILGILK